MFMQPQHHRMIAFFCGVVYNVAQVKSDSSVRYFFLESNSESNSTFMSIHVSSRRTRMFTCVRGWSCIRVYLQV